MGLATDQGITEERAALRRVATLVAGGTPPEEVFAAVAAEVGQLLTAEFAILLRYDGPRDTAEVAGAWTITGGQAPTPVGTRLPLGGHNVTTLVYRTGQPARIYYSRVSGVIGEVATRGWGLHSSLGVPVSVEGRLWGVMIVGSTHAQLLPTDAEERLAGFTELAATAIGSAQARAELRSFAAEQEALRRVATLVARAATTPEEVFAAVAAEAGRLLAVAYAVVSRYDGDGFATFVGGWTFTAPGRPLPLGLRLRLEGRNLHTLVFERAGPARIDDFGRATGAWADTAREWGYRSAVGVPISVDGRLWGVMLVGSKRESLPAGTEDRLAGFTELVATALANAEARDALTASRARIVSAADQTRQRIERDLHDGAQQRLVSLTLRLHEARAAAPPGAAELAAGLDSAVAEAAGVLEELREIARGLHPAILTEGGLRPALRALARRSAVPVRLDVRVSERLPEAVEIAAYYAVAEAVTNAAKHARAATADVALAIDDAVLRVCVSDDGIGGAVFGPGSGLSGLRDRAEALGGHVELASPPGEGTIVRIFLPLAGPPRPAPAR